MRSREARLVRLEQTHCPDGPLVAFLTSERASDAERDAARAQALAEYETRNGRPAPANIRALEIMLVGVKPGAKHDHTTQQQPTETGGPP